MTRPALKLKERAAIENFLAHWREGSEWELVEEPNDSEIPDALLRRVDGSEIVGLELTRHVDEGLAEANSLAGQLADAVERSLRARPGMPKIGAFLSFSGASALAIGTGDRRAASVEAIAEFITGRMPLSESVTVEPEELERAGVVAVHGIVMFPADELSVMKAGTTGHGPGVGVIQPTIDAKVTKLESYRAGASLRAARLVPSSRFGGVWLIVTVFEGPGISSSVLTRGAEFCLSRRDFDRAFVLDFWEGEQRRVIEIHRQPLVH